MLIPAKSTIWQAKGTKVHLVMRPISGFKLALGVSAIFLGSLAAQAYTLTANASTGGSLTKAPDQASYAFGAQVTVTAFTNAGYVFARWWGDINATNNPLVITMSNNVTMNANFALIAPIQNCTNRFNAPSDIASWMVWWGPPNPMLGWDDTMDAGGDPNSGSLKVSEAFTGVPGEQFMVFGTLANRWVWDDGIVLDGTRYTNLVLDLVVDSSTHPTRNNDYGPLELKLVTLDWRWIDLGTYHIPLSATNWTHIVQPINPALPGLNRVTGIALKMWSDGTFTNTLKFRVDNLTLQVIPPPPPLEITTFDLPDARQDAAYNVPLEASGGFPPYTWSLGAAALPPGVTLTTNGVISGTPATNGVFPFIVRVTDTGAETVEELLALNVVAPLQITNSLLAPAIRSVPYTNVLHASGGEPPHTWSLAPGSASLPAGLALTADGVIAGTPATNGIFNFSVRVTDSGAVTADRSLSLIITAPGPLQITTVSLPPPTLTVAYTATLLASGGVSPYTWSLAPGSASLPPGLTLTTNGVISGTPTSNGDFTFSVRATDLAAVTADQSFSLTTAPSLQITTTSLSNGTNGAFYSQALQATGGQPPYTWSLAPWSASLPQGLTLAANGLLSGTLSDVSGTHAFYVHSTDAFGRVADQLLSITVIASTSRPVVAITAAARRADGEFQFTFNTTANTSYTIQCSADMFNWGSLLTLGGSGRPLTIIDPAAAGGGRRFYRVKIGP
jgi:hypothetical protein